MSQNTWRIITGPDGQVRHKHPSTTSISITPNNSSSSSSSPPPPTQSAPRIETLASLHQARLNMPLKSASKVSLSTILDDGVSTSTNKIINKSMLFNQKAAMQKNNKALADYMRDKANLMKKISIIEKQNKELRQDIINGNRPAISYRPLSHHKQVEIARLHEEIVQSQQRYDRRSEEIDHLTFKTQTAQEQANCALKELRRWTEEKRKLEQRASDAQSRIPEKEREKEYLLTEIAKNEESYNKFF